MLENLLMYIFIISFFGSVFISKFTNNGFKNNEFIEEYNYVQSKSICDSKEIEFDISEYEINKRYPIIFNEKGNVNMAQMIQIKDKNFVIELGFGRIDEK